MFYFGGNPWQVSFIASGFMWYALVYPIFQIVFENIPNVGPTPRMSLGSLIFLFQYF